MESEFIPTGRVMSRGDFYDGDSVTVEVNPLTGEGRLKQ
ncbi:hypothetical Protein YC6258_02800 [Gynuella sunshinyii YC6258]|uniref:Uncharacterized protein n=1 Tax=Gynuella sunshinyii YC6258 TaxID=1445510 RepID=A0A0C5VNA1_9GAMM|nr:hypothetical Protein YC6258_02800 [Gynuella sunshinyii YC6258]